MTHILVTSFCLVVTVLVVAFESIEAIPDDLKYGIWVSNFFDLIKYGLYKPIGTNINCKCFITYI